MSAILHFWGNGVHLRDLVLLGGFYLVDAPDLDQAIAYAAMIPGALHGSIEIRPIVDWSDPSGTGAGRAEAVAG